jgi:hypothetical protein
MIRIIALLSVLTTTGCVVYPYGGYAGYGYGGYRYGGYGYGYAANPYPYGYATPDRYRALAASNYNPETGSRTGN